MPTDFYTKLSDLGLLRRAWHLARNDSRADFLFDPYRYADFAFRLEDYLTGLSQSLSNGTYHPKPLLTIDVPKSSLSVRPGSVVAIEDRVVLFAIACLIAPPLDKKLPAGVYSWRVKNNSKSKGLFEDHEIFKIPFLKRQTIQRRIEFVEPWYAAWPRFMEDLMVAYEREGYHHLVLSDITSYFENVDLSLLRDLLLHHLPKQPRIVNFLCTLLEYWAWPAFHGATAPRGIPQGNGVSSFLGNIYLLPLDQAFSTLARRRGVKYLRYMDDVKVLAKDMSSAREALFLMNERLRSLRLNIQGSKTRILEGPEILQELLDSRLNAVNDIIEDVRKRKVVNPAARSRHAADLKKQIRSIKGRKTIVRDRDLRLFRRLITGFTLLRHSAMVRLVLDQIERNPDSRLLNNAIRYLRVQDRNFGKIANRLVGFLKNGTDLFPYQKAHFLMTLRYMRNIPLEAWKEARHEMKIRNGHWYVRQQAAMLLGLKKLGKSEVRSMQKLYGNEQHPEVKRACFQALAQLSRNDLENATRELVFSVDTKLQRLGRFYHGLLFDPQKAKEQIKSLFNQPNEEILLDRLYEVEVLSKVRDRGVRDALLKRLQRLKHKLRRPILKERVNTIIERLQQDDAV